MRRAWRLAGGLGGVVLLGACTTLSNAQSARTIGESHLQVGIEPSYMLTRAEQGSKDQAIPASSVRYGVADRWDLGLRGGGVRPALTSKLELRDVPEDEVAVAWTASLGAWPYDAAGTTQLHVYSQQAVLVGVPTSAATELVLGPKIDLTWGRDTTTAAAGALLTAAVSAGWVLRPLPWLGFVPELSVGYPLLYAGTGGPLAGGGVVLQAGVAVVVDVISETGDP